MIDGPGSSGGFGSSSATGYHCIAYYYSLGWRVIVDVGMTRRKKLKVVTTNLVLVCQYHSYYR